MNLAALIEGMRGFDERTALLTPEGGAFTYRQLLREVDRIAAFLNHHGFGQGDRLAAVLPGGPEAALAFLAVAACCTYAPLNPGSAPAELESLLGALRPNALLAGADPGSPGRRSAEALGIPILEVGSLDPAGLLPLRWAGPPPGPGPADRPGWAGPEEIALLLPTSGTTSAPKLVPFLQRNLAAAAHHGRTALALGPEDRCLCFLPLFHLAGLGTCVLSTWASGGSLVALPAFDPAAFYGWLESFQPTWFTAVPAVHQRIVETPPGPVTRLPGSLRMVRCNSAPLPTGLLDRMEQLFQLPVLESYGMTETFLIASNPQPPLARKPGSVGLPAGAEVRILGDAGCLLPSGATGEIVVRGPSVFPGYLDDPEASAGAFHQGWFRTGDLGSFDSEGYLFIQGRVKELINRGGQKVAPREVEEALLGCPGVADAAVFPLPHPSLGEAVAAAVVLAPGQAGPTPLGLRRQLAARLAPYKIPARIITVAEIPKEATGKTRRRALAEHFRDHLDALPASTAPQGPGGRAEAAHTEAILAGHPALRACAVLPLVDGTGEMHLVAYCELQRPVQPKDLTRFIAASGAAAVLPTRMVQVAQLPRLPGGTVDRAQLASVPVELVRNRPPKEIPELVLAGMWKRLLGVDRFGIHDDFFGLGGDSLSAVTLLHEIEQEFQVTVPPDLLFERPTIHALVQAILRAAPAAPENALFTVQEGRARPAFFFVHGDFNGGGFHCRRLARSMGSDLCMHSFVPHGLPGQPVPSSIEALADHYLPLLKRRQAVGPYLLGGHCNGALVAYELASRLQAGGDEVKALLLVSPPPADRHFHSGTVPVRSGSAPPVAAPDLERQNPALRRSLLQDLYRQIIFDYVPRPSPLPLTLLMTDRDFKGFPDRTRGWASRAGPCEVRPIAGSHLDVFTDHLEDVARTLRTELDSHLVS